MELATGALGTLLPKLAQLLQGEYKLQKNVRKNIQFVTKELEMTQAALGEVGEVPLEQLDEVVRIWARGARELSYDLEYVVDTFLVRVPGPDPQSRSSRKFFQKMKCMRLSAGKHHQIDEQIGEQIKHFKKRVVDLAARRDRYKIHTINPVATLDPRITSLFANVTDLVGIDKAREELITKLTKGDDTSTQEQRVVCIVGFGGLGKTTLAKAVYDAIKSQFDCTAFVIVSQNPEMKKFLKDMLYELDQRVYGDIHSIYLDEKQLIDIAWEFLHDKRYLIVIDDIWDILHWDSLIKYVLPDNNTGCRIVTTTRIVLIAKHIGCAYEMQPLSPNNSRVLLYRRIFGIEDPGKCLNEELAQVSDRILKKCAGVPLAIITVASLLASKGRNKTEWDDVCNSIGYGMENSLDAENMRKILSYSYYDLPFYLRTCLLYLSIFPKDFEIEKDRLVRLWIAEGFIKHEKQRKMSLFELGESYFNELINRSMIQPMYYYHCTEIKSCHVHNMMFDLIHSITSEGNFVTILSNKDQTLASTMVSRLSLQSGKTYHAMTQATQSMPLVRSIVVFPSALDQIRALQNFKVLRVLDLQGCDLSHGYNFQYLGSLFHLKYLSLKHTGIDQLPEAVGNLRFLEILDISYTRIGQLPKCVAQLTHLLCLLVSWSTKVSNGIGSLTSLEELTCLRIDDESTDIVQGLGLLTELRVLGIMLFTDKWTDKLVESLCKLWKIQRLSIELNFEGQLNMGGLDAWVPPPQLRTFDTGYVCCLSALPAWMNNPMQFHDLVYLHIAVRELRQEDLEILGRLPALHTLKLHVHHKDVRIVGRRFVIGVDLFPCLVRFLLWGFLWPVMFQQGAMPTLRELYFEFHVPDAREIAGSDGGFDCGLPNLVSLQDVFVLFRSGGASEEEVEEAKAAVRRAAEIHPNQMKIEMMNCGLE